MRVRRPTLLSSRSYSKNNMKQLLLLAIMACSAILSAQLNSTLRSNLEYDDGVNDIWGYVAPDGTEYAIVGVLNGVSFVSLADPDNPVEVVRVPGDRSAWRDMKTYGDYAYVVADQGDDGIVAYDLRFLPDSVPTRQNRYQVPGFPLQFDQAHNIYIDETIGRAYTAGGSRQINDGGILMFDLTEDPMSPVYVGKGPETYSHDVFVLGDTMYCSEIYDGELAIYDISDLDSIITLGTTLTPLDFTHNAWTTADGQTIFTTDERANAPVAAYDISDKKDIKELYQFRPLESINRGVIPHNVHVIDDYLSISYYTDGLRVADASKPDNIIEVANYDTWLGADGDFNGAWGAYPFLPSGLTLVSDRQSGLFVVDVDYKRAARLEGIITDFEFGTPLNNVDVSISAPQLNSGTTDALGRYKTGLANGGTYEVTFTAENYNPLTVDVTLENGVCTILDTFMETTLPRFNLKVTVIDDETEELISSSTVRLVSNEEDMVSQTDINGEVRVNGVFETTFDLYVAEWGYETEERLNISTEDLQDLVIRLRPGFMDDFVTDEGWEVVSGANSGNWERAVPRGTFFGNEPFNPGFDVDGDIGAEAYVTGNRGTGAGDDDVDGDATILTSPVFYSLPGQDSLRVKYQYWFANDGGDTPENDTLTISINNNEETVIVRQYTGIQNEWTQDSFLVADYLRESSQLRLIVTTSDFSFAGHLVEAGFDNFRAYGRSIPVNTDDLSLCADCDQVHIFPNPSNSEFQLTIGRNLSAPSLRVLDALGRVVENRKLAANTRALTFGQQLPTGLYFVEILDGGTRVETNKVIKEQ